MGRKKAGRAFAFPALAAALCLLSGGMACGGSGLGPRAVEQRTVKIAVVDLFSGPPAAATGPDVQNSLQVAVDGLNARGGLLGQHVEIVAADGERNAAKVAELVRQQLSDDDVKLLVGPASTATFLPVKPGIAQAGVPNCVTAVADDALNGAAFTVRVGPSDVARVSALLGYLRQARPDVKKIGMVDDGSDSGQVYDRLLTDRAGRSGITYVGRGPDSDPGAAIQQLVAQGAQAVVLPDQPASATRTSQAVQQLGLSGKLQLLGFGGLATYDFPAQAGDLSVDSILVATNQGYLTGTPESAWSSGYRAFVNAITHQYGLATNGVEMRGTPAPADCVLGWSRAVERAGSFAGADVMKAWETLDIPAAETALGVRERVTAAEHTAVAPDGVFVYSWSKDGSRYRLKQLAGPSAG